MSDQSIKMMFPLRVQSRNDKKREKYSCTALIKSWISMNSNDHSVAVHCQTLDERKKHLIINQGFIKKASLSLKMVIKEDSRQNKFNNHH